MKDGGGGGIGIANRLAVVIVLGAMLGSLLTWVSYDRTELNGPPWQHPIVPAEMWYSNISTSSPLWNEVQQDTKMYVDLLLVIFSGEEAGDKEKRDALRQVYGTYGDRIVVGEDCVEYSFAIVFILAHPGAPDDGILAGDILYVNCPRGYRNIVEKTKKMMSVVEHFRFRYLLKSDDDTFVCPRRIALHMHKLPEASKARAYAGIPTACGLDKNPDVGRVIKDKNHKWYDEKYVNHTMGGMDCYPVYMQGAFYLLSFPLVSFLHVGNKHLLTFTNEDVTVGSWLLGVERDVIALNTLQHARLWECSCARPTFSRSYDTNVFFHNCKEVVQLQNCHINLQNC